MSKTEDQQTTRQQAAGEAGGGALADSYGKVSDTVASAYSAARETAGSVGSGIEASPIAALLGGLAIGAIAGALLPRLEKEKELLAPLGDRVGGAARAALDAGKAAGREALDESGLTPDALRGQVSKLVDQAIKAAGAAGTAAASAAREAAGR